MEHAHYTYLLEAEAQTFPLHQVGGDGHHHPSYWLEHAPYFHSLHLLDRRLQLPHHQVRVCLQSQRVIREAQ
jgi:hypothetical protein